MKCQFCENEATVFYTQVIDGKSKKINMCESCAEEQGITSLEEFKIADFLMADETPKIAGDSDPTINLSECPDCGFTLDDLRKIGRLGCSSCYSKFTSEIDAMLKNMHKGKEHKGKVPVGMLDAMQAKKKLDDLKSGLAKAIEDENYEKAAKLRDELASLTQASTEEVK